MKHQATEHLPSLDDPGVDHRWTDSTALGTAAASGGIDAAPRAAHGSALPSAEIPGRPGQQRTGVQL
ncbi:MAG TPA: hypothetical protein VGL99_22055 [Chloroflexota bacterium]